VTGRGWLVAGAVATTLLVVGAGALRVGMEDPAGVALPDRLLAVLIALALLLGALLALPGSPAVTGRLLALASGLSAFDIVAVVRSQDAVAAGGGVLTLVAASAIVVAVGVAGGSVANSSRAGSRWLLLAVTGVALGVAATVVAAIWAIADPGAQAGAFGIGPTPLRIAARVGLVTWVGALLVGLARDLAPPAARAAARTRERDGATGGELWRFLQVLADELSPSRTNDRRAIVESERARLAADLHALVLPDLRRAASNAQAAGAPEAMQVDLRRALEDVEQLMLQRQSIVLEQFGLIAALEWLAERTQERSPLRVELELEGGVPEGPGGMDPAVARAAFRIALLALDNVTRHASATTATVRLAVSDAELRLQIADDGQAGSLESVAGRGLADMRDEASVSGGSIAITSGPGARVEARWRFASSAGKPSPRSAPLTDRRGASAG
jgi:signal transduction histidine kinase